MFRRSKTKLCPPEPPTFAQILEDLNTFDVERPATEEVRITEPSTPNGNHSSTDGRDANLTRWWSAFETFQTDVQDMQKLRRHLLLAKTELIETNDEVAKQLGELKEKIADALGSVETE